MKVEREIKMELTLDNLVKKIIELEYQYYCLMFDTKRAYGENSDKYNLILGKWSMLFSIANEFGFLDKLKR